MDDIRGIAFEIIRDPSECEEIIKIYHKEGGCLNDTTMAIAVGRYNGEIVALQGLDFIPHGGPLWIHPDFRGQGIYRPLNAMFETLFNKIRGSGYFMFPSNNKSKSICKKLGLTKMDWEVWKREF